MLSKQSACSLTSSDTTEKHTEMWEGVIRAIGPMPEALIQKIHKEPSDWEKERTAYRRSISKTTQYIEFHASRIEKGQRASSLIGNQYTGSIFLALDVHL